MVASKTPQTRQRRNRITSAAQIEASPATRVELAEMLPDVELHPMTVWTWDVWWASPLTSEWVDADVPDLITLVKLVDAFWKSPTELQPKIHAEIRMASREFGLTPMSRRGLQWEIRKLEQGKVPAPTDTPVRSRDPRLRALG